MTHTHTGTEQADAYAHTRLPVVLREGDTGDSDEAVDVDERDDAALGRELADLEHLLEELVDGLHRRKLQDSCTGPVRQTYQQDGLLTSWST